MSNRISFENLAAAARQETPPPMDVTHRVMRTLQAREDSVEHTFDRQWAWCAATSVALAALIAIPAAQAWLQLTDPMSGLLSALSTVMP
jgi:hypothetical protein